MSLPITARFSKNPHSAVQMVQLNFATSCTVRLTRGIWLNSTASMRFRTQSDPPFDSDPKVDILFFYVKASQKRFLKFMIYD